MTSTHLTHAANPVPDQIPTLTQSMVLKDVPDAVRLALEARTSEKKALLALSDELVQNLRPEIERLTAELVRKSLEGVWENRARIDQNT